MAHITFEETLSKLWAELDESFKYSHDPHTQTLYAYRLYKNISLVRLTFCAGRLTLIYKNMRTKKQEKRTYEIGEDFGALFSKIVEFINFCKLEDLVTMFVP
jgi:hypothetical protein